MTRKEIEKMLQVSDVRETRVFQEAREEGLEQGLERGRQEAIEKMVLGMLALDRPVSEIAKVSGWSAVRIRSLKKKHSS